MFPTGQIEILRQDTGRFDRRHLIGPANWPHFDLFWIHEGTVRLELESGGSGLLLCAPDGVLLFPATPFAGRSQTVHAEASICHFRLPGRWAPGYLRPDVGERLALQTMIALSQRLAQKGAEPARRTRLLRAILDEFGADTGPQAADSRIDRAWRLAAERLDRIRGLADVAAQVGLSQSAFRAAHRAARGGPAGAELVELRLSMAERLLATTPLPLHQIAAAVGYGHAGTLSHAFRRARGLSPGAWRRANQPFA